MVIQDDLIRDDTSTAPDRDNILALTDDLIDTVNNTLRVVTYEQLKPALLAYLDASLEKSPRCQHHAREIRRLLYEIGDTSIHSERWTAHAGELRYAVREYFREEDLVEEALDEG